MRGKAAQETTKRTKRRTTAASSEIIVIVRILRKEAVCLVKLWDIEMELRFISTPYKTGFGFRPPCKNTGRPWPIFYHPDCHCRYRNHTGSCLAARGLYRRWDFHPAPKIGMFFLLQIVLLGRIAGEIGDHRMGVRQIEHLKNGIVGGLVLPLDDGVLDAHLLDSHVVLKNCLAV